MSRFEGEISAAHEAGLDLVELLADLSSATVGDPSRWEAMACFLSAGQGWRDAAVRLGGTFAEPFIGPAFVSGGVEE